MKIAQWQKKIHAWAKSKGWWDDKDKTFADQVANFHSEITEAWEEYRNGHTFQEIYYKKDKYGNDKPEGIPIELADEVIRIMDTCERYKIDLESAMRIKFKYNKTRPYKHGGKKA